MLSVNYEHNEVDVGTCQSRYSWLGAQCRGQVQDAQLRDVTLYFFGRFKMCFMILRLGAK